MNIIAYKKAQKDRQLALTRFRQRCAQCRKAVRTCYCHLLRPFESVPQFVILIHRDEARNSVATGRMASLCLKNSKLIQGMDFSNHAAVESILCDPALYPVVLYPGLKSINLSLLSLTQRQNLVPPHKKLVILVIDGTWAKARKMQRLSRNLQPLPRVSFNPRRLSTFKVRQQPKAECLSTIEAIHEVISLFDPKCDQSQSPQANLLEVFSYLVDTQVTYREKSTARSTNRLYTQFHE